MAGRPRKTAAVVQTPGAAPAAAIPDLDVLPPASLGAEAEARAKFTHAADIDPTAIRQPVMTPDGWLCPEPKPVG